MAEYTITVTNGLCTTGITEQVLRVHIPPFPKIIAGLSLAPLCNGEAFHYEPPNQIGDFQVLDFSWNRDATPGILQDASTGNAAISETLTNTTNAQVNVTYRLTAYAYGCSNGGEDLNVTINPTPVVNEIPNQTVMSGGTFALLDFSGSDVTQFKWENSLPEIGLVSNGIGSISAFVAKNPDPVAIEAEIKITPFIDNCIGEPMTFIILVSSVPELITGDDPKQSLPGLFPNPASGHVTIKGMSRPQKAMITSMTGTTFEVGIKAFGKDQRIELGDLSEGLYILQIQDESGFHKFKLVKK